MLPVTAVKVAEIDPAAILTDVGTVSAARLLDNVTEQPPAGAAWLMATVQVLEASGPRLAGLHVTVLTVISGVRLNVTICEVLPRVAVTVADCDVVKVPVVAVNGAEVAPAATVADAGTVNAVLLLARVTPLPPAGAA